MIAPENRGPAIAAAIILIVFGIGGFYLPTIMLALGEVSTVLAAIFAALFVLAFFGIFWLRGRSRREGRGEER